jgi:hypothetical protein
MSNDIKYFENVLTEEENTLMLNYFINNKFSQWFNGDKNTLNDKGLPLKKILNIVNGYFDLSKMVGLECWSHVNTRPDWHVDSDEFLFSKTGEIKTPICSIVYYASVNNLIGGKLLTKTDFYIPKTNTLVTFAPNIMHYVESFTGERIIVAINPWEYEIGKFKLTKSLL